MKKLLELVLLFLFIHSTCFAATQDAGQLYFPQVNWSSKNPNDVITIYNPTNIAIFVLITVSGNQESPGINVSNCGPATHLKPGSVIICFNINGYNPIYFSNDTTSAPATGTYQIRQRGW